MMLVMVWNEIDNAGYMWDVLIFSPLMVNTFSLLPPGMAREHGRYLRDTYPLRGYMDSLITRQANLRMALAVRLDAGFEFYAPQTMEAPDGRDYWSAG